MIKSLSYTFLTVLTVDLLATSGDITMTWTSPILPKLYSNESDVNPFGRPITADEESWIGSLINIGAMVGPLPYGFLAKKFGRKISLLCIAIPHILSYLIFAFSKTVYLYYIARLLGGIAVGGGYTILPMYVAEVAEDSNRGMFSSTLNNFWTFGNLIPYVIGPYISIMWFNVILACIPTAFFILFFLIAPESPYYLIIKNKPEEAKKVLMKLRSHNEKQVEKEINNMQKETEKNDEKVSFVDFLKSRIYRKGLIISLVLILGHELSGLSIVLFYTQKIFESAGVNGLEPEISSIIIGVVIFSSSFFLPFVVDRMGRRILLLISLMGDCLALFVLGTYFYLKNSTDVDVSVISWLPILSLIAFSVMTTIGVGFLPWTISSELFPTNVKPYAAPLVSITCWITSFAVTKFYNDMEYGMGQGGTFWFFSGCCLVSWFFTIFFVPETKGKSFQEIQDILENRLVVLKVTTARN